MSNLLDSRYAFVLPLVLLLFVMAILLASSVLFLAPKIENSLAQSAREHLTELDIDATISMSGRDLTVSGKVRNESSRNNAEATIKKVCGIRFIENQLLVDRIHIKEEVPAVDEATEATVKTNLPDDQPAPQETIASIEPVTPEDPEDKDQLSPTSPAQAESENSIMPLTQSFQKSEVAEKPNPADAESVSDESERIALVAPVREQEDEIEPDSSVSHANNESRETESINSPSPPTAAEKSKTLNYENMLAAMTAYYREKNQQPVQDMALPETLKVEFTEGDSMLPASVPVLDELAQKLKTVKNLRFRIIAIADGSALALQRAKAIQQYLVKKGAKSNQLEILGREGAPEKIELQKLY